jgi:diacylglycerol kinase (ATP)
VIANPAAGTITTSALDELGRLCERHGVPARVVWTRARGDATRLARAAAATEDGTFRVIVSAGGDGTTREVAEGLVKASVDGEFAQFIVPAGTGNSGYRAHWGEQPWPESLAAALADPRAHLRRLDAARVVEHDRLVVLGAGAGLTADVLNLAPPSMRGRGKLQAGLEQAARRFTPYPGRVSIDDVVVHEGPTVFVNAGGGRHRAWQYLVLPHSVLDDGLLDVCAVGAEVAPDTVPALLREGRHLAEPGVVYRRGRRVLLERTDGEPLCFEHDGELVRDVGARVTVEVLPGVLPVLCLPRPTVPENLTSEHHATAR